MSRLADMLGYQAIALPSTEHKVPNCLCSISTRQLDLLLWRTRPDSSISSPQYLHCMASKNQRKHASLWHSTIRKQYLISLIYLDYIHCSAVKRRLWNIVGYVGLSGLVLQSNCPNYLVLILNRQLGNY